MAEGHIDYTKLTGGQLLEACGDQGIKWAQALSQYMRTPGFDLNEETLATWFANAIMNGIDIAARKREADTSTLTPAEAVYGVLAWLTTQPEPVTLSTRHDASMAAVAADRFCKVNQLGEPRAAWCRGEVDWQHPDGLSRKQ